MKHLRSSLVVLAALAGLAPAAYAQTPAIGGTWHLTAAIYPPDAEVPCEYEGDVPLAQDGDTWTGPADLTLVSEVSGCPEEMLGDLTGMISTDVEGPATVAAITGAIDGSDPTGHSTFVGFLSTVPAKELAEAPRPPAGKRSTLATKSTLYGDGELSVDMGDFVDASGSWSAVRLDSIVDVPGLTPVGLTFLVLLVLAAGALTLRSHQGGS